MSVNGDADALASAGFVQLWTDEQYGIIEEHINYHAEMLDTIIAIRDFGLTAIKIPKKPASDLTSLLGKTRKSPKTLLGHELNEYLVKHISTQNVLYVPTLEGVRDKPTTLDGVVDYLKNGFEGVKQQHSAMLRVYLDYGVWLNYAFELYFRAKMDGEELPTWGQWLHKNIGINESYARKLRSVATLLNNYPRFRSVGLPFTEIYKRKNEINNMLEIDNDIAEYWKSTG